MKSKSPYRKLSETLKNIIAGKKELRKMSRLELIELIYAMKQENNALSADNESLCCKIKERSICLEKTGSIAEAALALNEIFELAQKAADEYVISTKNVCKESDGVSAQEHMNQIIETARKESERMIQEAQDQAFQLIVNAQKKVASFIGSSQDEAKQSATHIIEDANHQAELMLAKSKEEAEEQATEILNNARNQAEEDAKKIHSQAQQEIDALRESFYEEIKSICRMQPEIARNLKNRIKPEQKEI